MKKIYGLGLLFFMIFLLVGCGDDSAYTGMEDKDSASAKKLEVSAKLDSGDYDYILSRKDDVTALDYAAAAIGKAGFSVPALVDSLTSLGSSTSSNDLSSILAISVNSDALQYLIEAQKKIQGELSKPSGKSNEKVAENQEVRGVNSKIDVSMSELVNFQKAITNLMIIVTAIGQVGDKNTNSITNGFDSSDGISATEAEHLGAYLVINPNIMVDTDGDGDADDATFVSVVVEAIAYILASIEFAGLGDADIKDAVKDAATGAESINYDGIGIITADDIANYLQNVIN